MRKRPPTLPPIIAPSGMWEEKDGEEEGEGEEEEEEEEEDVDGFKEEVVIILVPYDAVEFESAELELELDAEGAEMDRLPSWIRIYATVSRCQRMSHPRHMCPLVRETHKEALVFGNFVGCRM